MVKAASLLSVFPGGAACSQIGCLLSPKERHPRGGRALSVSERVLQPWGKSVMLWCQAAQQGGKTTGYQTMGGGGAEFCFLPFFF